ncbi:hypothetical protein ATO6_05090 [Oceanicola sp. 22II-s10i]|nr:hypothetical protein ATO6_05090 [Oceanicola sp. 22II-s10i]
MGYDRPFKGAKIALIVGGRLLVVRRDVDKPIPWPGYLDLPGGGRENGESPLACALREAREEIGLVVSPGDVSWRRWYDGEIPAWFFLAHLHPARAGEIRFGNEGQGWDLVRPADYLADATAVPHFRSRLRDAMTGTGMMRGEADRQVG